MRSRSARSRTSRSATSPGTSGSPATATTGAIITVSVSSGSRPAASQSLGEIGRLVVPVELPLEGLVALGEHPDLARDQLVERVTLDAAEIAIADRPARAKPVKRQSGPSRSTATPSGSRLSTSDA